MPAWRGSRRAAVGFLTSSQDQAVHHRFMPTQCALPGISSAKGLPAAGGAIAYDPGARLRRRVHIVMAGLVPAIHDLSHDTKNVDARDKSGHDEFVAGRR